MTIQTVIIEDEEKSLLVIQDLMDRFAPDLKLAGTAGNVAGAIRLIEEKSPLLVFMDIQIADGTGFDVLRALPSPRFELICITAFDQYAVEAFRFAAVDYLLKPIGIVEFKEAVDRAGKRIGDKDKQRCIETLLYNLVQQSSLDRKICISTSSGQEFIDLRDIVWCKAEGSYTLFHLVNTNRLISSRNIGGYEELLCANNFYRIHNDCIINLRYVKSYIKGRGGQVVMTSGDKLEISQRRKSDFLDKF